jgi:predicted ATP-dependent serine protease
MDLQITQTKLTKVKDITVPDIFNRRMKTGIDRIDNLFEEGILPGSAFTLTAKAGCGKTTLMLQILDGMSRNGYNVGYFSGEESIYQLAYTAKRVNATEVQIANLTDIDEIADLMTDMDLVIVDSFQALTSKTKMNARQLEKHAVQRLTKAAKDTECTVGFIMHLTKSGDLKGGTIVPHTVDANIKISTIPDSDNDCARVIYFEKNRFGPLNELECTIGFKGYDFDAVVTRETENQTKAPSKQSRKQADIDTILNIPNNGQTITLPLVARLLENNVQRAQFLLRELTVTNTLIKWGRGQHARWTLAAPATLAAENK